MTGRKGLSAAVFVAICSYSLSVMANNAAQVELMDNLLQRMNDAIAVEDVDAAHEILNDMDSYKRGMRANASPICFAAYDALGWVLSDLVVEANMEPEDRPLREYAGHKRDFDKKRMACAAGI